MSYRDGSCQCGAGTYRQRNSFGPPKVSGARRRLPRRCVDCDLTTYRCRCVVRLTVHMCPLGDSGEMPCCGLSPFERMNDRMTLDPRLVNCSR